MLLSHWKTTEDSYFSVKSTQCLCAGGSKFLTLTHVWWISDQDWLPYHLWYHKSCLLARLFKWDFQWAQKMFWTRIILHRETFNWRNMIKGFINFQIIFERRMSLEHRILIKAAVGRVQEPKFIMTKKVMKLLFSMTFRHHHTNYTTLLKT